MDVELEEKIIKDIKYKFLDKTVLFITHRLTTTYYADDIYRLKDGNINIISKNEIDKLLKPDNFY